jgi:hypothetical protein
MFDDRQDQSVVDFLAGRYERTSLSARFFLEVFILFPNFHAFLAPVNRHWQDAPFLAEPENPLRKPVPHEIKVSAYFRIDQQVSINRYSGEA